MHVVVTVSELSGVCVALKNEWMQIRRGCVRLRVEYSALVHRLSCRAVYKPLVSM